MLRKDKICALGIWKPMIFYSPRVFILAVKYRLQILYVNPPRQPKKICYSRSFFGSCRVRLNTRGERKISHGRILLAVVFGFEFVKYVSRQLNPSLGIFSSFLSSFHFSPQTVGQQFLEVEEEEENEF